MVFRFFGRRSGAARLVRLGVLTARLDRVPLGSPVRVKAGRQIEDLNMLESAFTERTIRGANVGALVHGTAAAVDYD